MQEEINTLVVNLDGDNICSKPITNERTIPVMAGNQEGEILPSPQKELTRKRITHYFFPKFCNFYK